MPDRSKILSFKDLTLYEQILSLKGLNLIEKGNASLKRVSIQAKLR